MTNKPEQIENENQDAEKYFDDDNYSTLIVGGEKAKKEKKRTIEDFVELLTSGINEDKTEVLKLLKEAKAQEMLIEAIADMDNVSQRHLLIAACWESGLDFSKHIGFFFDLAIDNDLMVSLEAITVIENIEAIDSEEILEEGISKLSKAIESKHPNSEMLNDLKLHLFEVLKSLK